MWVYYKYLIFYSKKPMFSSKVFAQNIHEIDELHFLEIEKQ